MVPQLQVFGHVPKKYLPINLFDIHVKLYRCEKFGEFLVGHQFRQVLAALKFPSIRYDDKSQKQLHN